MPDPQVPNAAVPGPAAGAAPQGAAAAAPADAASGAAAAATARPGVFHLHIVTPYDLFFDGDATMVVFTGTDGEYGVLAGHHPAVVALAPGEIRIQNEGAWRIAAASNGYAEVDRTRVTIVVTSAEWPEDIDVERAQRALDRAVERIGTSGTAPEEIERSKNGVRRAKTRLHVASEHGGPADRRAKGANP